MQRYEYRFGHEGMVPQYQIVDIGPQDTSLIQQALGIYDVSLGQKYIPFEDLVKYIASPEKYVVIGSNANGQLLGVMVSFQLDEFEVEEYNYIIKAYNVSLDLHRFRVGMIKSVAVDPLFRHKGVGTKLTIAAMQRLARMSCDAFLAISWVSNRPDSSQPMFEKLGYQKVLSTPNYWTEDSIKNEYQCPNCGNPCHCEAIYYFRTL